MSTLAGAAAFTSDELAMALRAAGVAVSSLDLETGVGITSPDWADIIGLPPEPEEQTFDAFIALVHPDDRERVIALHADPAAVAQGLDFEFRVNHPARGERWLHSRSLPATSAESGAITLVGIAVDITDRKSAETALRVSEARHEFLLHLGDALRPLVDAGAIQGAASRIVGEHLQTDRAYFVEIDDASGVGIVGQDYVRGNAPSLAGRHPLAVFSAVLAPLRQGLPFVCDDVTAEPRISDGDRVAYLQRALRSFLSVPLIEAGALSAVMSVTLDTPRRWTTEEIALLRDVAERTWEAVERGRSDAALRASEQRMRLAMQSARLFLWDLDLATDAVILSENIHEIIGLPSGSEAPDTTAEIERSIANAVRERAHRHGSDSDRAFHDVTQAIDPFSGETIWLEGHGVLRSSADGQPLQMTGVGMNVTGRVRAEQALRESEEKYRSLFESIDQGFCIVEVLFDGAGRAVDYVFRETNPAFARTTGLVDVVGRRMRQLAPDHEEYWFAAYGRVARTGVAERLEAEAAALGRWYNVYAYRVGSPGEHRVAALFEDVSARRLAEEARRGEEGRSRGELETQVLAATTELRDLSRRLLSVQEEERRHLARELHDEIGQTLTGLSFQLAAAAGRNGQAALTEAIATVQALTEQVRQLSMELRPAVLDSFGLLSALEWYTARYQQRTGIAVELRHEGLDRRFSAEVEVGAYRVAQEALTNVARHAAVDAVTLQLLADDGALTVAVRDRGRGFDPARAPATSGLGGMRERIALLGGTFDVDASPGRGTAIMAEIPLDGKHGTVASRAFSRDVRR